MQRNRLAAETSPYLLQHADNPVDWYPWCADALATAQRENKPILLSVGYSACHWCHVMAHESFEDENTAAVMNRLFVNIKVDREERPDLDKIYQAAQQLITQRSGGWPLTMFLTPDDQKPFFGGTYFPRVARHGMPAFVDLLDRVATYYRDHGQEIREQNAQLLIAMQRLEPAPAAAGTVLDAAPLAAARDALERSFDGRHGGFGRAPKFPHPTSIERCLRHWHGTSHAAEPDLKALYMASLTLTRMAEGGIYDQLAGGFARYSVDDLWMIAHFEKMLYDNGQLLSVYTAAALATGEPLFRRIAAQTADWLVNEMRSPQGAFYSSLDADSQGHEGKFYVWTREEVRTLLTPEEDELFARRFGLDREPNFEGQWHLHVVESIEALCSSGESVAISSVTLDRARAKLLAARAKRVPPGRDEKILTAWSALVIKGLAIAGRTLNRPDFTDAAAAAVDFIHRTLWRDGRLLATAKDGRAHLAAYLDDYAFLADALLELLQSRWRTRDLVFARELIEVLLTHFEDPIGGGFYFTAADHERLLQRSKTFSDEAIPSGNGIAAQVLCRLGYLCGEWRYLDAAERTLKAAGSVMQEFPQSHMSLINALEEFLSSTQILIIRGAAADAETWARKLGALYAPTRMIFAVPVDAVDLPEFIERKSMTSNTTAYLCSGMVCSPPIIDLDELARSLALRVES